MAANYAMQCYAMDVQYIVYQYSIHMYFVKFTLCPRDLVLARKQNAGIKKIPSIESLIFFLDKPYDLFLFCSGSSLANNISRGLKSMKLLAPKRKNSNWADTFF